MESERLQGSPCRTGSPWINTGDLRSSAITRPPPLRHPVGPHSCHRSSAISAQMPRPDRFGALCRSDWIQPLRVAVRHTSLSMDSRRRRFDRRRPVRFVLTSDEFPLYGSLSSSEKGKPRERTGRKATGHTKAGSRAAGAGGRQCLCGLLVRKLVLAVVPGGRQIHSVSPHLSQPISSRR